MTDYLTPETAEHLIRLLEDAVNAIKVFGIGLIVLQVLAIIAVLSADFRAKRTIEHHFYTNPEVDPKKIVDELEARRRRAAE